jgi:hypothetical protein
MKFAGQPLLMPFWEDERTNLIAADIAQGNPLGIYVNVLGALEALKPERPANPASNRSPFASVCGWASLTTNAARLIGAGLWKR